MRAVPRGRPQLEQIANERRDELKVVKVNVDEEPELAARFGIASIPTILLFRAGSPVAGTVGARGGTQLENALGLAPAVRPAGEPETGGRRGLLSRFGRGVVVVPPGPREMGSDTDRPGARQRERDAAVVSWRRQRLLAAGFSPRSSEKLARDMLVELHGLLDLVQGGYPPELAARILAPVDGESRRK